MLNTFGFFRLCSLLFLARSQRILTHSQLLPPFIRTLPNSPYPYKTPFHSSLTWSFGILQLLTHLILDKCSFISHSKGVIDRHNRDIAPLTSNDSAWEQSKLQSVGLRCSVPAMSPGSDPVHSRLGHRVVFTSYFSLGL